MNRKRIEITDIKQYRKNGIFITKATLEMPNRIFTILSDIIEDLNKLDILQIEEYLRDK